MSELTREALARQQEILADIAFHAGARWATTSAIVTDMVMDKIGGSRGLIEEFKDWANEFDLLWEAGELDQNDYIGEVDAFTERQMHQLIMDSVKQS